MISFNKCKQNFPLVNLPFTCWMIFNNDFFVVHIYEMRKNLYIIIGEL